MSDNELDNLFKEAADGFKPPNDPSAWQDMSRKLDQVAVTASFWNWKTISSTVGVGVVVIALVVYMSISDANTLSAPDQNMISSSNATKTQTPETEGSNIGSSENKPEAAATQKNNEDNLTAESPGQNKKDNSSIANATASKASDHEGSAKSQNLTQLQTQASQQNSTAVKNADSQNSLNPGGSINKNEVRKGESKSVSPSIAAAVGAGKVLEQKSSGTITSSEVGSNPKEISAPQSASANGTLETVTKVAATEKVLDPTNSGSVASEANNSKQGAPVSNANNVTTQGAPPGDSMKKPGEGGSGTVAKVAATEKVIEPKNDGSVTPSESKSREATSNEKQGSETQKVVAIEEMKKPDEGGSGTVAKVAATEKALEPKNAGSVTPSESKPLEATSNNKQGSETQKVVAIEEMKKPVEEKKEVAITEKTSDQPEMESKEEKEEGSSFNRLAVKLVVAPDYSTVKSVTPNGLGINYGGLIEYRITKHWSVATGGIWSKKIYSAKDVEYNGYNADRVDGDCRMWDIPVNVYYNFTSNKPFSFYASAGFSSYLMNEENYVYYVETAYGSYEHPKQVKGENNEWFKTLNLSVGMQFRMSQQFSLQFEPTLKAPLAGVGEGEVSLVSLGAFFNLRYEIPFNKLRRNED
jgi:hypothetical protein